MPPCHLATTHDAAPPHHLARYDHSLFDDSVITLDIDDHNPPPLLQLQSLCQGMHEYLIAEDSRVASVHCKGGKGRTGTAICCYLIEAGIFNSADSSREYVNRRIINIGFTYPRGPTVRPDSSREYTSQETHIGDYHPSPSGYTTHVQVCSYFGNEYLF